MSDTENYTMFEWSLDSYESALKDVQFWQDHIKKELAYDLDRYMERNSITATALAEKLGVTKSYVSHMHAGRVFPSVELMRKLAHIINSTEYNED